MAARRKRNVSRTWIVVGTVTALVAGGTVAFFLVRGRKPKSLTPTRPPRPVCPPGKHVGGDPSYRWPHEDLFLDSAGFGEALEAFGYEAGDWSAPGWSVCIPDVRHAVTHFQRDYNRVRGDEAPALPIGGLVDDATVRALAYVDSLQQAGDNWPLIVAETRAAGRVT